MNKTAAALDPTEPCLVQNLIERARQHPLGVEFLLTGSLSSVAVMHDVHAFTVEAARIRLRKEETVSV